MSFGCYVLPFYYKRGPPNICDMRGDTARKKKGGADAVRRRSPRAYSDRPPRDGLTGGARHRARIRSLARDGYALVNCELAVFKPEA